MGLCCQTAKSSTIGRVGFVLSKRLPDRRPKYDRHLEGRDNLDFIEANRLSEEIIGKTIKNEAYFE